MSSYYVGPNGRLYQRKRNYRMWIAATIVSIIFISALLIGIPNVTAAVQYAGLL
jgi:hypothetical protein